MKYVILIMILGISGIVQAQNKRLDQEFVRCVIGVDSINYVNGLDSFSLSLIADGLKQWTVNDNLKKSSVDVGHSFLNYTERRYVRSQLEQLKHFEWKAGLVNHSIMIDQDTINKIFNANNDGWYYFNNHYRRGFYIFSKPIFFRNNTFCIFYYSFNCGGTCGQGQLCVYKNNHGKWEKFNCLSSWVS